MEKKIKIYLCDCVHNYLGVGTFMFPLNIGYLSAYARKFFPKEVNIKLFKYPSDFINQCKKTMPDIVGFSNYTWNADLNNKLSKWIKSISPKSIVVFGGPNINYSLEGYKRFFATYDSVDFYIPYQGEIPFVNFLREIFNNNLNLSALKSKPIDGIIFYDNNTNSVIQGQNAKVIKELDTIPSPYLTGILDEFFDDCLIPIIETSRGCPYACTFCAQGLSSHNRVIFFSLERVKNELNYIAHRVRNTNILHFADANFGITERDITIVKYIAKLRKENNYPYKFNTNWAKNQPRLLEIAKILTNSNLCLSLQSLDEVVLKNTKRTNIKLSIFKDIMDKINAIGAMSATEIILGLPGETKESHIRSLRQLFDWNVSYIICYNALVFGGSEMASDKERKKFSIKTKFRLSDNSFGKYDTILSFDIEEGIRSTSTISEEEILYFRPIHWLIQFLWNYRFYYDLLKYLQSLQINPFDYIIKLVTNVNHVSTPLKIKKIFQEFKQDAELEWFDSPEILQSYYSQPEKFRLLKDGQYGKLNGRYIFRVLLEAREDFERYLYQTAISYSPICQSRSSIFEDTLSFLSASIINFSNGHDDILKENDLHSRYNIMGWKNSGYKKNLEEFYCCKRVKLNFYLPKEQSRSIKVLLKQYEHDNKNVTLRKMSENMDIRDFFYKVKVY